ncbi:sugar phosphate nucleotidyltransferase [Ureibacillus acetophenoni]|uniref:Mannose-1-phosphate guanylyltransferase n=1 Tax=Ureibacillus acetophenoni TaxID=614649 RepID=A0A285U9S7_9BACL|nr:sugar phosphate nucleotidyltransferase [Ureibacillus acetophenoni]SOC38447.1 mannose-1-phosphate guanylyltransferase [Ureibacillus acetophenoni]
MHLVLLSGGSGQRLWPLSSEVRPKQFLKLLKDENGRPMSMVQRVWAQLSNTNLKDQSIIATNHSQIELMSNQLGKNIPIIIEPEKRGTFPAIVLATVYLHSVQECSEQEVVGVLPVDPFVEYQFFQYVKDLESTLINSSSELALIGVKPTSPSTKYGYIVPKTKNVDQEWLNVDYFREKPDEIEAKKLIDKGALWNCGVFAFQVKYILDMLKAKGLPTEYEKLICCYDELPNNSFDYEVVEKGKKIVVLPYERYWKDLGTWNTLTEEMDGNVFGKGKISEDSINCHIINELDIPITLLGGNNIIVAASSEGILVTDRDASTRLKNYIDGNFDRPMYEERRWGWYRVLDHTKYKEGNEVLTKRIGIKAGKNLSYQLHYQRSEFWTIIKGEGIFVLNDNMIHVRAGNVLQIPLASKHAIKAITDMEIIEVQSGGSLIEEDIVRITLDWEETVEFCRSPQLQLNDVR